MDVDDWSSDYDTERQLCHVSKADHQPIRGAPRPRSQLRPARKILPFVPYPDWDPGQPYDNQPPFCIHYIIE